MSACSSVGTPFISGSHAIHRRGQRLSPWSTLVATTREGKGLPSFGASSNATRAAPTSQIAPRAALLVGTVSHRATLLARPQHRRIIQRLDRLLHQQHWFSAQREGSRPMASCRAATVLLASTLRARARPRAGPVPREPTAALPFLRASSSSAHCLSLRE